MKFLKLPNSSKLLSRILADPELPEKIRALEPSELARLIDQVGLEDCGEIVSLASPQQIQKVFDEDLWRSSKPGEDESFDAHRFGLWIEILLELGASTAAEKIAEMDSDFLVMALSQLIWVIDFPTLRDHVASESRIEKIMDSSHFYEIEDFIIFSRDPYSWDAVLSLLVELDTNNHSFLNHILETCSHFSSNQIEDEGGLYSVLTSEEQLKSDVAYEREKRREAQGFVSPADARAFLKLALGSLDVEDHVSPAHFRDSRRSIIATSKIEAKDLEKSIAIGTNHRFAKVGAMVAQNLIRMEELNYLANVLISGWEIKGRVPRQSEAAQIVLETCEKGLTLKNDINSLIDAFRVGWATRKK